MAGIAIPIAAMLAVFILAAPGLRADGEKAGRFDYYVLSLGWSPSWCLIEGDRKGAEQCHPRHDFGFVLHGLWPQNLAGWPSYCPTPEPPPTRRMTAAMADIMGGAGLAWHQWNKHGRCSGLSAAEYFARSRQAFEAVRKPEILRRIAEPLEIPARLVEQAFLEVNPALSPEMVTVTCKAGYFHEIRICLGKDLAPRPCAPDASRDCRRRVILPPVR